MTCNALLNDKGEVNGFVCSSAWGIGVYEDAEYGSVYGFGGSSGDPHDFCPDYECCTPQEIQNWKDAKAKCECGR